MKSEEKFAPHKLEATGIQPEGVQRDSETPVAKKPSILFLLSTLIGVATIIILSISAFHGITQ